MYIYLLEQDIVTGGNYGIGVIWCEPEFVRVTLIGKALNGSKSNIVLSSFNAG